MGAVESEHTSDVMEVGQSFSLPPIPSSVALSSSLLVSTLGVGLGHSAHCGLQELEDSAPIAEAQQKESVL